MDMHVKELQIFYAIDFYNKKKIKNQLTKKYF